jgi:ubiquinone/menaquinone biosynthesis C-methylase UbiE
MNNNKYILKVGDKGLSRLKLLNNFLNPQSQRFIYPFIKPGITILEAGCGTGIMTEWLANQTGTEGKVIAIDSSEEQIAIAKQYLAEKQINNVQFIYGDILELSEGYKNHFDIAYCRFLMLHLKEPEKLIELFYYILKTDGIAIFEEPIFTDTPTYPETDIWDLLFKTYMLFSKINNIDANYGSRLINDVFNSKFTHTELCHYYPILTQAEITNYIKLSFNELGDIL